MIPYTRTPNSFITVDGTEIASFVSASDGNMDADTVQSFGDEWNTFSSFTGEDIQKAGEQYFDIVTGDMLGPQSKVLDIGCGTGRWSKFLSAKVGFIEAIDPSSAVIPAARLVSGNPGIRITQCGVGNIPFPDASFDFVFSLGVMHHLPDTQDAISKAVEKLKPGGHFLIYLYYSLDNRSVFFKMLFFPVHILRMIIHPLPHSVKKIVCDLLAVFLYLPMISLARAIHFLFPRKSWYKKIPLSYYWDKNFKIIRNDALDRLGTPLEKRFRRKLIEIMLTNAGLTEIVFSENEPFWHAVGKKKFKLPTS
ncbi:MAG TPA: class I SAM-dependent methyltransferase [Bacteroidia bacterium]|nr:class I SAM-dependent methyltransferase [Bacteroidia bacterium]